MDNMTNLQFSYGPHESAPLRRLRSRSNEKKADQEAVLECRSLIGAMNRVAQLITTDARIDAEIGKALEFAERLRQDAHRLETILGKPPPPGEYR